MKQTKVRERERNIIYFSRIECEMKRITFHKPQATTQHKIFIYISMFDQSIIRITTCS